MVRAKIIIMILHISLTGMLTQFDRRNYLPGLVAKK